MKDLAVIFLYLILFALNAFEFVRTGEFDHLRSAMFFEIALFCFAIVFSSRDMQRGGL